MASIPNVSLVVLEPLMPNVSNGAMSCAIHLSQLVKRPEQTDFDIPCHIIIPFIRWICFGFA